MKRMTRKYNRWILCAFLGSALFVFYEWNQLFFQPPSKERIQSMLPPQEHVIDLVKMEGGWSNDIWQVQTESNLYILRKKNRKTHTSSFAKNLEITKTAFALGIGPCVIGENSSKKEMLLEYIAHISWPSYEENSIPYQETMKKLKIFHEKMPHHLLDDQPSGCFPFTGILSIGKQLVENALTPPSFSVALAKIETIFQELKPWLQEHQTLCHGDFYKQNVLLKNDYTPVLIDFDSSSIGDPFLDVAKFSLTLPLEQRYELLQTYLGKAPTLEESRHFELVDLSLLMLVATIRFQVLQHRGFFSDPILSPSEMEALLQSSDPLPSFLEVPFEDRSYKTKQLGALYALAEFLKRAEEIKAAPSR